MGAVAEGKRRVGKREWSDNDKVEGDENERALVEFAGYKAHGQGPMSYKLQRSE